MTTRQERLAPDGVPRWIRVYDSGGTTLNRYTVVFTGHWPGKTPGVHILISVSEDPYHIFCQHAECRDLLEGRRPGQWPPKVGRTGNLGRRIAFADLPVDCQRVVWDNYRYLWNLAPDRSVSYASDESEDDDGKEG